jgi:hypothetical protein
MKYKVEKVINNTVDLSTKDNVHLVGPIILKKNKH